ncbi:MAG TPA: hypothetical protein VGS96_14940, partial [Thermoanaerobaculia bacterium]|nr:hypothetical protein [Thermoanaerobaculia bacterium]
VLEDRNLTDELLGREDRATKMEKLRTTSQFLFKNSLRSLFRRFKRYGYAVVTFGDPISVDDFVRDHPSILAAEFEQRKPELQQLTDLIMNEISDALPITPVPLVARIFADHPEANEIAEQRIIEEIGKYRERWAHRVWLTREKSAVEIWHAARDILVFRHLIDVVVGGWRWNPAELLLRDFYANSLMTFAEVKRRGWPERAVIPDEALAAAAAAH